MIKIERKENIYAIFSKWHSVLYKKVSELVREFDIDIGVILLFAD